MGDERRRLLGVALILAGLLILTLSWLRGPSSFPPGPTGAPAPASAPASGSGAPSPPVSVSREPLVPTRTPTPLMGSAVPTVDDSTSPSPTPSREASQGGSPAPRTRASARTPLPAPPSPVPSPAPEQAGSPSPSPAASSLRYRGRFRWGVGVVHGPISRYPIGPLRLGWYLDWRAQADPPQPEGIEYVPMVRVRGGHLWPEAAVLAQIARARPGALWLIGNEPDVKWQDNVDPTTYARLYHEAYVIIKEADPTAWVGIGGVSQPTPLRMRYLDAVLAAYWEQFGAAMPVDVWNVHNFILREERGSWGVDIPPGLPDRWGRLYTVDDSGNLAVFRQQIWEFRRWMAGRGYRGWPLIVSEYGIPMPEDYGFPPERVIGFLRGTFEFFLTAADPVLGDPTDGYRLVQRWCWYSLDDGQDYPTGSLFDPQTGQMTLVGKGWVSMVSQWTGGER